MITTGKVDGWVGGETMSGIEVIAALHKSQNF